MKQSKYLKSARMAMMYGASMTTSPMLRKLMARTGNRRVRVLVKEHQRVIANFRRMPRYVQL